MGRSTPSLFSGARLRLARRLSRRTQAALAAEVSVDPAVISRAERGEAPSPSVIDALAEVLEVYPEFFANEPRAQLFDEDVHFRRRAAARVVDRQQALAHSSLFGEFLCSLEEHVDLPMDVVPTITARSPAEIEGAAAATRAAFGLPPNDRLENVVRVLENAGIVVALPRGYVDEVDAFSAGPPSVRKIVILNANDPASRTVFNAAHELGHLVLHAGRPTGDKASEAEADAFASSFLMPRQGISREFPRGRVDWRELFRLKERWHVSVAALLRRGKDLGHISQVDYLGARKYISSKGWNKKEPGEFTTPRPELVQKAVLVVHEHCNLTFFDLASAQHLQPSVLGFITGVPIPEPPAANSVIALASRRPNGSGVFDTD